MAAWIEAVNHVQNGEVETGAVLSRATRDLEARTDYLKSRLDSAEIGSAIFDFDRPVEPGLAVGMACWWNGANGRYERALTGTELGPGDTLIALDSADVMGIVSEKSTNTLGDIVLQGKARIVPVLESGGMPATGRYFLSAAVPGTLVDQTGRPVPGVPVLHYDALSGFCYVAPYIKDFVNEHLHLRFELEARPAGQTGQPSDPTQRHVVTNADASIPGWLPANHPSFGGNAPVDAAWGYNLPMNPDLQAAWPPVPLEASSLLIDRDGNGAVEVPLGPDGLVELDAHGIWWKSNCYADVPWPVDYEIPGSTSSTFPTDPCPRHGRMRIYVAFSRMSYANDRNVVTSLNGDTGGTIQVVDSSGQSASTGKLYLQLNQAAMGGSLRAEFMSRVGSVPALAQGLAYEAFVAGQAADAYWKIRVPTLGLPSQPGVALRLQLRGSLGGTLPQLTVSILRIPQAAVGQALSLPAGLTGIAIGTTQSLSAGQYVCVTASPGLAVAAGDDLLVRVSRSAVDGYAGEVGVLDIEGALTGA